MGGECYKWWGNEFYDVVTIDMKYNWKPNWTVSFIETKKPAKAARESADISTLLHSDSFIINTGQSQGI